VQESPERRVIAPEEGHSVSLGSLGVIHKITARDTQGFFSVVEHPMEPGTLGAIPHTHTNEDEYSFLLEGEVGVLIGEDEYRATPGTYVLKPRGVMHTFWNPGPSPARILEIISPAGFEGYFEEMAEVISAAAGGPPDFGKMGEIAEKYGLRLHPERLQEIAEKHGVELR
jgi:mannose-6-phosphate isomerase-like protein (cupin superfamily)